MHYFAGAPFTANVMGDCPHHHRTPEAAGACIERTGQALRRQPGGQHYYCDRQVMVTAAGVRSTWDGELA